MFDSEFSLFFDIICAIMKKTKENWGDVINVRRELRRLPSKPHQARG